MDTKKLIDSLIKKSEDRMHSAEINKAKGELGAGSIDISVALALSEVAFAIKEAQ